MSRTIEFYRTKDGKCPVIEFLDRIDGRDAQKILWVFRLIERIDHVPKPYLKKLSGTNGIYLKTTGFSPTIFVTGCSTTSCTD